MSTPYQCKQSLTLTTSLATTPAIIARDKAVGRIIIPAGLTVTTLTFYEAAAEGDTYVLCQDVGTAGVLTVAQGNSYKWPSQLVGSGFVKIVGSVAETIILSLKA